MKSSSFSKLKLIKTFNRSSMKDERLSGLTMISIESDMARRSCLCVCGFEVEVEDYKEVIGDLDYTTGVQAGQNLSSFQEPK